MKTKVGIRLLNTSRLILKLRLVLQREDTDKAEAVVAGIDSFDEYDPIAKVELEGVSTYLEDVGLRVKFCEAMALGGPSRSLGNLSTDEIEVFELERLLHKADGLSMQSEVLGDIVTIARAILDARYALKTQDMARLEAVSLEVVAGPRSGFVFVTGI